MEPIGDIQYIKKNQYNFAADLDKVVDPGFLIKGECLALVEVCALFSAILVI